MEKHIGRQIHAKRKSKRMSQKQLAAALDPPVTHQQVQKYERGANITVKRLHQIANVLGARPANFFPDVPSDRWHQASGRCARLSG